MSTKESVSCKVYENHSQDTRYKELGDVCQTVSATYGMGGNNQPLVVMGVEDMDKNEPTVFRGDSITSPINKSNPQPGDSCHTLTDDNRNYLVGNDEQEGGGFMKDVSNTVVRRLTPL